MISVRWKKTVPRITVACQTIIFRVGGIEINLDTALNWKAYRTHCKKTRLQDF